MMLWVNPYIETKKHYQRGGAIKSKLEIKQLVLNKFVAVFQFFEILIQNISRKTTAICEWNVWLQMCYLLFLKKPKILLFTNCVFVFKCM